MVLILSSGLANVTKAAYKYRPNVSRNVSFWQVFCYRIVLAYLTQWNCKYTQ